jgi:competence ComEA-like helix-hairpin-helix protein
VAFGQNFNLTDLGGVMTRQEFGAILFIGLSLFVGSILLLIRQVEAEFLPDLAGFEPSDSSGIYPTEEAKPSRSILVGTAEPSDESGKLTRSTSPLSINTASPKDLQALPGIGPELARRMVLHRQQLGPFTSFEQLLDVKGIGHVKLNRLKPYISFH